MSHYIALFEPIKNGGFGVSFPDFPGCVSAGDDFEEALQNATEALSFHVDGMQADGETIPDPADPRTIFSGFANGAQGIPVAVPLLPSPGKTMRIQVTLDSRLLSEIDMHTKNRSAFLAEAAADRLRGLHN